MKALSALPSVAVAGRVNDADSTPSSQDDAVSVTSRPCAAVSSAGTSKPEAWRSVHCMTLPVHSHSTTSASNMLLPRPMPIHACWLHATSCSCRVPAKVAASSTQVMDSCESICTEPSARVLAAVPVPETASPPLLTWSTDLWK